MQLIGSLSEAGKKPGPEYSRRQLFAMSSGGRMMFVALPPQ